MVSALALALLLPLASYAQDVNVSTVTTAFQKAKVIPDVLPLNTTFFLPLDVVFTANGSTYAVTAGANLTEAETAKVPSFALRSNNTQIIGKPYLITIVDPDASMPQSPTSAQFRHFLAADYIADNLTDGEFIMTNHSKTATLTDYIGPSPPAGSAPHRYVVLCYLQNSTGVTPPSNFNASNRANFNITQFIHDTPKNNYTLVGATFFHVSPNDTVGSVPPNQSSPGVPSPSGTAPAGNKSSDAMKFGIAFAWAIVGVFSASAALLL